MLLFRSPTLLFALIYFLCSVSLAILIFNIPYDDTENLLQLLIISPPLNSIFVFLFALTWIERRFRLCYVPSICLVLLFISSILLSIISFRYLHISKLVYFSLIYHSFFAVVFLLVLILIVICYSYGSLYIHRFRSMMTTEQQNDTQPKDVPPLKVDQLVLQTSENDQLFLHMSILPGRRIRHDIRNIEDDLNQLQQIQTIITLNESKELSFMNMTTKNIFNMDTYSTFIKRTNHEHIVYPIRDRFIPKSIGDYIQFIFSIIINAKNGNRNLILIHCMGGMGRTGMTVVCLELAYEYLRKTKRQQRFIERFCHYPLILPRLCRVCQAICNVRRARPGTIYNPIQIYFIHEFYARLQSNSYMEEIKRILHLDEDVLLDTSFESNSILNTNYNLSSSM